MHLPSAFWKLYNSFFMSVLNLEQFCLRATLHSRCDTFHYERKDVVAASVVAKRLVCATNCGKIFSTRIAPLNACTSALFVGAPPNVISILELLLKRKLGRDKARARNGDILNIFLSDWMKVLWSCIYSLLSPF